MVSGPDFIFIFESVIMLFVIFIVFHVILSQEVEPSSFIYMFFGLFAMQIANTLEISLFGSFILTTNDALIFLSPIIEEILKFGILLYLFARDPEEEKEMLLQGLMLGMGFANGELIGYAVILGPDVLFQRTILLPFTHPLFSMIMAYGLYQTKQENWRKYLVYLSLPFAILLHMLWNAVLVYVEPFIYVVVILNGIIFYLIIQQTYQFNLTELVSTS